MVHKGYTRGWSSRQHDSTCVYVNAGLTDVHAESNLDGSTNVECEGHVKRDSEATTVHGHGYRKTSVIVLLSGSIWWDRH